MKYEEKNPSNQTQEEVMEFFDAGILEVFAKMANLRQRYQYECQSILKEWDELLAELSTFIAAP